jgi:hypothetical protein
MAIENEKTLGSTAAHLARLKVLKSDRMNWDDHWQEISDYIYPKRADFTVERSAGERRQTKIFDSTPVHANELLASGLHGMLTNPATTWASLLMADPELNLDENVQKCLRAARDIMFEEINNPNAGFSTAMHEVYMDFGAFNTAILFVGESKDRTGIVFNARSLVESYIAENSDGQVDTLYRCWKWTVRQALDKWSVEELSAKTQKLVKANKLDEKIEILHVIEPRNERDVTRKDVTNLPYTSTYIEVKAKHKIRDSGYHEKPFMGVRFAKSTSGEVYGRGPGVSTLPDVKMLNAMMKTTIKAAQKVVDPTILAEDDSIIGVLRSVPAGINYYRRGSEKPSTFQTGGDIRLGEAMMDGVRARIREAFFIDQLQLQQGPQMTATEVLQRTEEKLRLMGPVLGRLQTELLGPMIDRIFAILLRQGKFPPIPEVLEGLDIKIEYESPIARAQKQLEAGGILRTFDIMSVLINTEPTVMDNFDGDEAFRHIGMNLHGIDPRLYRDKAAVESLREQRAKAQEQAFELEMAQKQANVNATNANAEASGSG